MISLTPMASHLIHNRGIDKTFEFPLNKHTTETVSVNTHGTILLVEGSNPTVARMYFIGDLPLALSTLLTRSERAQRNVKTINALKVISSVSLVLLFWVVLAMVVWWVSQHFFGQHFWIWGEGLIFLFAAIGIFGVVTLVASEVLGRRSKWTYDLRDSGLVGEVSDGSDGAAAAVFMYCLPVHLDRITKAFLGDSEEVALEVFKRFALSWVEKWQVDMTEAINRAEAVESAAETQRLDDFNRSVGRYLEGVNLDDEPLPHSGQGKGHRFGRDS